MDFRPQRWSKKMNLVSTNGERIIFLTGDHATIWDLLLDQDNTLNFQEARPICRGRWHVKFEK